MQVTAKLNNLRMAPRKVRIVANLVKGMDAKSARAQLMFVNKKPAGVILKLLNSALSNAKHNFSLPEDNFYIAKLVVEGGPSLKRWMPRAMGRATPLLKRTCNIDLQLEEKTPSETQAGKKRSFKKEEKETVSLDLKPTVEKEETISAVFQEKEEKRKGPGAAKPYDSSSRSKKRFFSRQTFGNIKRAFRRKSI
jgi:large subunit ribosomal protein L22